MSLACSHRFQLLERPEDLDDAIRYLEQARDFLNLQHPSEKVLIVRSLDILADVLLRRFSKRGDLNDLNAAIDAESHVVDTQHRAGVPDPMSEMNLSVLLNRRFVERGRSEDICEAVAAAQRALDLLPPNDSRVILFLINLSDLEFKQYCCLQNEEFLLRGAQHVREAWALKMPSRADDEKIRYCLIKCRAAAACLWESYKIDPENVQNLDTVIAAARFYISTRSTMAVHYHVVLCDCLFQRWKGTSDIKYIDEAINVAHDMIELTKTEVCELTVVYMVDARKRSGKYLSHRHKFTRSIEDRENALAVLLEGFRISEAGPGLRIQTAQLAIDILTEVGDWDRAWRLSREILDLFVILNGRSLSWQDKRHWMLVCSYHASTYASIALEGGNNVFDVINMFETCRGSILGHVIDSRTDLNDLMEAAPEKAKLFRGLIDEINIRIDPRGNMNCRVKQTARRIEAEREICLCLQEIRAMKGFHNFMLGPTEEELKGAATRGPILIVNISSIRSDAIIITKDEIVLFRLPELKYEKAKEYLDAELTDFNDIIEKGRKNRKYQGLLAWLWNTCVKHIFKKLDDLVSSRTKLHVWWIGVGIASSLPFHAAGIYTGGVGETALSRAISSYIPTIKILIHSQRKLKDNPSVLDAQGLTGNSDSRFIQKGAKSEQFMPQLAVIIMPSTSGSNDLKGVRHEAEEIQRIVHDTYMSRILLQPSAKDTMEQMAKCEVVHFACHAESTMISDPSGSHLLLGAATPDSTIDKVTLKDVAAADLGHGKLAFLSACSTAQDSFGKDMDEVLHLASGFQVAGYLHAIGNLWRSDDEMSVQVVKEFYRHLVAAGELGDGEHVAEALNKTLMGIAGKYVKDPLSWAQFVHFGV